MLLDCMPAMLSSSHNNAEFPPQEPNKYKPRGRARRPANSGLDTSRIPHLLRPYILSLNVLQTLIEKNGESSTASKSTAYIEESPVFKCGRSLANKVVRRYGRPKTRAELADPTWSKSSSRSTSPVNPVEELYQYQPPHHQFGPSTFVDATDPLPAHIEVKRRIQNAVNAYEAIMRAGEPVSRQQGVRTLAEMSSTVVGRGMEDWISDEVLASSKGMPVLKDDGRVLAARDYCYDIIPAHSRTNVLAEHAITLAAYLPDHAIKFRFLGRLVEVCHEFGCESQARHAVQALIPCPSLLHPRYIHAAITSLTSCFRPQLFDAITSEILAHMATLNPVECFSESVQTFFQLASGVNQVKIMAQVMLCAHRLHERRQDEPGMWDMLNRWSEVLTEREPAQEEIMDVVNIFRPLFTRYLVESRKSAEDVHHILLSIAISLIFVDTVDFLAPIVACADLQSTIKAVNLGNASCGRLWQIVYTIEGLNMPFLEVHVLEALDSHPALSDGPSGDQRNVEMRLKDAQRRLREARSGLWWDEELGEWADSSPVKMKTTEWLLSDWDSDAQSDASSGSSSNFLTPPRLTSITRSAWQEGHSAEEESDEEEDDVLSATSTPVRSKSGDSSLVLDTPGGSPDLSSDPLADDSGDLDDDNEAPPVLQALLQPIKAQSVIVKPQPNRRVTFSRSLSYSTAIPISSKASSQPRPSHSSSAPLTKHRASVLKPILSAKCKLSNQPDLSSNACSATTTRTPLSATSQNLFNTEPLRTFSRTKSLPCLASKRSKLVRSRAESEESEDPLDCFRSDPEPAKKRIRL